MRSITEAGGKFFSRLSIETERVLEQVEKLVVGCHKGYVKLQSGRISRSRLTMTDLSDEKAAVAWTEQVMANGNDYAKWPQVLRPQRPQQLTLHRWSQNQRNAQQRNHRMKLPSNSNVDIFNNPPVFLMIKDIKKQKVEGVSLDMNFDVEGQLKNASRSICEAEISLRGQCNKCDSVMKDSDNFSDLSAASPTFERTFSPVKGL